MRIALQPNGNPSYTLTRIGEKLTIGRKQECDIIHSEVIVSGVHCQICLISQESATVEDFSTNGTYINATRIRKSEKAVLRNNDTLTLGKMNLPGFTDGASTAIHYSVSFDTESSSHGLPLSPILDQQTATLRQQIEDLMNQVRLSEEKLKILQTKHDELLDQTRIKESEWREARMELSRRAENAEFENQKNLLESTKLKNILNFKNNSISKFNTSTSTVLPTPQSIRIPGIRFLDW
jgi:pSer/pThr/pTyr-binding forkhead associated (FHA) protein